MEQKLALMILRKPRLSPGRRKAVISVPISQYKTPFLLSWLTQDTGIPASFIVKHMGIVTKGVQHVKSHSEAPR